ncbi:hypothetical protein LCGC14_2319480, partial [marine sediment metagenome]
YSSYNPASDIKCLYRRCMNYDTYLAIAFALIVLGLFVWDCIRADPVK